MGEMNRGGGATEKQEGPAGSAGPCKRLACWEGVSSYADDAGGARRWRGPRAPSFPARGPSARSTLQTRQRKEEDWWKLALRHRSKYCSSYWRFRRLLPQIHNLPPQSAQTYCPPTTLFPGPNSVWSHQMHYQAKHSQSRCCRSPFGLFWRRASHPTCPRSRRPL